MKSIAFLVVVIVSACGGKSEPARGGGPQEAPMPIGETAPGGVPGTPDQCCCELPESRGSQHSTAADCAGQQGTCKPAQECHAVDEPSPMN